MFWVHQLRALCEHDPRPAAEPAPEDQGVLRRTPPRDIALSADGRYGTVSDLRLRERPLGTGELSLAELLAAIRWPLTDPLGEPPGGGG